MAHETNPAPPQNVIDFGELAPAESELRLVVESSVFNEWQPSGGLEAYVSMPLLCGLCVLLSPSPPMVQVMITLRSDVSNTLLATFCKCDRGRPHNAAARAHWHQQRKSAS